MAGPSGDDHGDPYDGKGTMCRVQAALTALGKRFDPYMQQSAMFHQHQESEMLGAYTQAALLAQQGSLQTNFDYSMPPSLFQFPPVHPVFADEHIEKDKNFFAPESAPPPVRPPLEVCTELDFVQDLVRSHAYEQKRGLGRVPFPTFNDECLYERDAPSSRYLANRKNFCVCAL